MKRNANPIADSCASSDGTVARNSVLPFRATPSNNEGNRPIQIQSIESHDGHNPNRSTIRGSASEPGNLELTTVENAPPDLVQAWRRLRSENGQLASPYYDFEFTRLVSQVRDDVQIAFTRVGERIDEIFPFQFKNARQIGPVGGLLNDVHGVISATGSASPLMQALLKKVGFPSLPFHALKNADPGLAPFQFRSIESYFLDLSNGWNDYQEWAKKNSSTVSRHGQKARAMARDMGPVRFEFDVQQPELLETLIKFKRARYQRSKTFDILSVQWAANLLRKIFHHRSPNFRGLLSAVWAGDTMVAVHFGMLTDNILHYWFPVYDLAYAKYSPGTELLLSVAKTASEHGITKVDLGVGDDPYKFKFANATETMACGEVTNSRLAFQIARQKYIWRHQLKSMPLKPLAKNVLRAVFPKFGGWNFR